MEGLDSIGESPVLQLQAEAFAQPCQGITSGALRPPGILQRGVILRCRHSSLSF